MAIAVSKSGAFRECMAFRRGERSSLGQEIEALKIKVEELKRERATACEAAAAVAARQELQRCLLTLGDAISRLASLSTQRAARLWPEARKCYRSFLEEEGSGRCQGRVFWSMGRTYLSEPRLLSAAYYFARSLGSASGAGTPCMADLRFLRDSAIEFLQPMTRQFQLGTTSQGKQDTEVECLGDAIVDLHFVCFFASVVNWLEREAAVKQTKRPAMGERREALKASCDQLLQFLDSLPKVQGKHQQHQHQHQQQQCQQQPPPPQQQQQQHQQQQQQRQAIKATSTFQVTCIGLLLLSRLPSVAAQTTIRGEEVRSRYSRSPRPSSGRKRSAAFHEAHDESTHKADSKTKKKNRKGKKSRGKVENGGAELKTTRTPQQQSPSCSLEHLVTKVIQRFFVARITEPCLLAIECDLGNFGPEPEPESPAVAPWACLCIVAATIQSWSRSQHLVKSDVYAEVVGAFSNLTPALQKLDQTSLAAAFGGKAIPDIEKELAAFLGLFPAQSPGVVHLEHSDPSQKVLALVHNLLSAGQKPRGGDEHGGAAEAAREEGGGEGGEAIEASLTLGAEAEADSMTALSPSIASTELLTDDDTEGDSTEEIGMIPVVLTAETETIPGAVQDETLALLGKSVQQGGQVHSEFFDNPLAGQPPTASKEVVATAAQLGSPNTNSTRPLVFSINSVSDATLLDSTCRMERGPQIIQAGSTAASAATTSQPWTATASGGFGLGDSFKRLRGYPGV